MIINVKINLNFPQLVPSLLGKQRPDIIIKLAAIRKPLPCGQLYHVLAIAAIQSATAAP